MQVKMVRRARLPVRFRGLFSTHK